MSNIGAKVAAGAIIAGTLSNLILTALWDLTLKSALSIEACIVFGGLLGGLFVALGTRGLDR